MARQLDKFSGLRKRPKHYVKLGSPRDLPILLLLAYRAMYSVELAAALEVCFFEAKAAGLYGTLHRLERLGLVRRVKKATGVLRLTEEPPVGNAIYWETTPKGTQQIEHIIAEATAASATKRAA